MRRSTSRSRGVNWSSSGSNDGGAWPAAGSSAKASSTNPASLGEYCRAIHEAPDWQKPLVL